MYFIWHNYIVEVCKKTLSGVGFEPTPPFGDQNARSHCLMGRYIVTLSLAP